MAANLNRRKLATLERWYRDIAKRRFCEEMGVLPGHGFPVAREAMSDISNEVMRRLVERRAEFKNWEPGERK